MGNTGGDFGKFALKVNPDEVCLGSGESGEEITTEGEFWAVGGARGGSKADGAERHEERGSG